MTPPTPYYGGVSQKQDALNLNLAARVLEVARSIEQAALELAMVEEYKRIERPTVAQICAAWLGERITAEEAMEAISLHPAVLSARVLAGGGALESGSGVER